MSVILEAIVKGKRHIRWFEGTPRWLFSLERSIVHMNREVNSCNIRSPWHFNVPDDEPRSIGFCDWWFRYGKDEEYDDYGEEEIYD